MILGTIARLVAAEVAREATRRAAAGVAREAVRRAADPAARRRAAEGVSGAASTAADVASDALGAAATLARRAAVTGAAVAAGVGAGIAGRAARLRERLFDGDEDAPTSRADRTEPDGTGERADPPGRSAGRRGAGAVGGEPDEEGTMDGETTHFGYRTVGRGEKASLVGEVFDSVAPSYDVMNDLMSLGIHRLWKRFAIEQSAARPGQRVLDIAGGTGDLAEKLARRVGSGGQVLLADINAAMLRAGRERLVDAGVVGNVFYAQSDAEALPLADDTFDCVTIAFGLRNVTDKARALDAMYRVLKPGGRLIVLEFSKPVLPLLARAYDAYSFTALPFLGKLVANDADSYRYLAESIRVHPDQDALAGMMEAAGFERVEYHNLTGGIVALHKGFKL